MSSYHTDRAPRYNTATPPPLQSAYQTAILTDDDARMASPTGRRPAGARASAAPPPLLPPPFTNTTQQQVQFREPAGASYSNGGYSANTGQLEEGGFSAAGADFRRKKSLVRPDRERIDPSHRLYNYRTHTAAMEAGGASRGFMPSCECCFMTIIDPGRLS